MSVEKHIKAAKDCHENHTVNLDDFKKRVFQQLEKQTPITYRRRATFRKLGVLITATAVSLGLVIGVGVTSPSFADTLKQIPLIQTVFDIAGDDGLKRAQEKGLVTDVQKVATDKDITVTITEVFYDGAQISVGYILESPDKLPDLVRLTKEIKINGILPESWGAGGSSHRLDDHRTVGVINFKTSDDLPGQLTFDLSITEIGDQKGEWFFSFPVVKNDTTNKQLMPMITKTYEDTTVVLEKITFTVNSTELVGQLIQPPKRSDSTVFELLDEKGNQIGLLSSFAEEREADGEQETIHWKAIYQPVKELPKTLTVRPITRDQENLSLETGKGLELTVPIENKFQ
ncbi:DUF4179 domain-containing protein [Brevibacillus sp. SYSU BS000544]|uniref:DUF4179 domain-containing protein n=1 Tax=Brevibacillus sp. SYSU BS000544 TaxID=3416443 RepID=UPI003CE5480C